MCWLNSASKTTSPQSSARGPGFRAVPFHAEAGCRTDQAPLPSSCSLFPPLGLSLSAPGTPSPCSPLSRRTLGGHLHEALHITSFCQARDVVTAQETHGHE
eukprot:2887621-Pyramimonas_sp.AAC.1